MQLDKPIQVDLGNAVASLKFDFNALVALEEQSGHDIGTVFASLKEKPMSASRLLLWAGLLHERPNITLAEAGAMVSLEKLSEISRMLIDATKTQIGTAEGGEAEPADPQKVVSIDGGVSEQSHDTTSA